MDKPISTITLEFLEGFAQDKDRSKFRESLSSAVRIENNLFDSEAKNIKKLTKVEVDGNRYILAKIPLVNL
ncbi:MAG: DUF3616 domain-containing protein [Acidobacteria bacterium]|nr:DUF3616 domain-containing protein [Acidobacteriota bacterium]